MVEDISPLARARTRTVLERTPVALARALIARERILVHRLTQVARVVNPQCLTLNPKP